MQVGEEKSIRFFNYPYQALEEAVVNALYHRDYTEREPVEITIEPHRISILSHSGPDRSISMEKIREAQTLRCRKYRNRRLGEFLKELELTEGRATGIPTIQRHLRLNGSPAATIETDEGRTYFMIDIPCHPAFLSQVVSQDNPIDKEALMYSLSQVVSQVEDVDMNLLCEVLMALREPHNMKDLMQRFGQTNRTRFRNLCINPLLQADLIALTIPDKPNSKLQQYVITEKGMHYVH